MKKRDLVFTVIFTVAPFFLSAQSSNTEGNTAPAKEKINYMPRVSGIIKARFETSAYDGQHRFNVRNARLSVSGLANPYMGYGLQTDFSDQGKISVLDAFVSCFGRNFEVTLGQQQIKFGTDLGRGPNVNVFANRSFLAKFLTTYYGWNNSGDFVTSFGSRDLGIRVLYNIPTSVPVNVQAGLFNGSGINNPQWSDGINFSGRVEVGDKKGLRGAFSHYNGKLHKLTSEEGVTKKQGVVMWGGELTYERDNYRIEAEYAQRRLKTFGRLDLLQTAYVQGYYQFRLSEGSPLDYIAPVARWDIGKDIEFMSTTTSQLERFTANRATIGVNFGFVKKIVGSEIRLNYEKFFMDKKPSDFKKNKLLQDKFTVEVVASF